MLPIHTRMLFSCNRPLRRVEGDVLA